MIISHKYKFLIVNIPKTGTNSYIATLNKYVDIVSKPRPAEVSATTLCREIYQHEKCSTAIKKFEINKWCWSDYFKYTTIRNPWSRYASYFFWSMSTYKKLSKKPIESLNANDRHILKNFDILFNMCNFDEHKVLIKLIQTRASQDSYFLINNEISVDYIAKLENIQNDFLALCSKVGIENAPVLRHENKNDEYNYKNFYNQETIDKVATKERYLIDNYGYQY